jgi:hypothetical protein
MLVVALVAFVIAGVELYRRAMAPRPLLAYPWVEYYAPFQRRWPDLHHFVHAEDVKNHVIPPRRRYAKWSFNGKRIEVRDVSPDTPWPTGPDPDRFPPDPNDFVYHAHPPR